MDLQTLEKMKVEYIEAFEFLFQSGFKRLNRSLKVKLAAIEYCKNFMRTDQEGNYKEHSITLEGKTIHDKQFSFMHKLFFEHDARLHNSKCNDDCHDHMDEEAMNDILGSDAHPENFKPMYLYEIDKNSDIFESDREDEDSEESEMEVSNIAHQGLDKIDEELSDGSD